jgi:lysyl-tRNA synthetase class 2
MVEWYRVGISFADMIQETCEFLFLFFGPKPIRLLSYRDAFQEYVGIDYTKITLPELQKLTQSTWERDTCLHYLITHQIEPKLGLGELTVLTDFPPHEAALACLQTKNGEEVAERYEIYHEGVELTNGYHELADANELRTRFIKKNLERTKEGKAPYTLDEKFLSSLKTLPDCCGVALGFDRALMLKHKLRSIRPIIPYAWDEL